MLLVVLFGKCFVVSYFNFKILMKVMNVMTDIRSTTGGF